MQTTAVDDLPRSRRVDPGVVDVRVDSPEEGAQRHEHDQNDEPDEHFSFRFGRAPSTEIVGVRSVVVVRRRTLFVV